MFLFYFSGKWLVLKAPVASLFLLPTSSSSSQLLPAFLLSFPPLPLTRSSTQLRVGNSLTLFPPDLSLPNVSGAFPFPAWTDGFVSRRARAHISFPVSFFVCGAALAEEPLRQEQQQQREPLSKVWPQLAGEFTFQLIVIEQPERGRERESAKCQLCSHYPLEE